VALLPGARLGPYEIIAPLGSGGMGEVYRARDSRLGREVAVKVLPEELASDAERLGRFEQEARSASALNHPNIVTIYDVGREGAVSYIAMELVEGRALRELLIGGALATRKLLAIGAQIADGLARAHAARIVHRDLKPENVMVTTEGLVKILDFGLAKLSPEAEQDGRSVVTTVAGMTAPGLVLGTAGYMSPEQASGRPVDYRSDQFSLGAILYELATGLRAFQRGTAIETLSAIVRDEPPPLAAVSPQAPEGLRWIIERCLAKDPEDRYASTRDLARDLTNLRDRASESRATPPITAPRPAIGPRRKAVLVAVAVGILAIVTGVLLIRARRTPPPKGDLSLAILPFQNLGGHGDDHFADGMTESLITDLAKAKYLLVIARNSVFKYKGRPVDVRDVGRELKVRYVLEGSVQRAGDSVRINAQLIDAATGYHLWAEKYDRPMADIFALQDDISRRIAVSLQVALAPADRPGERPPTRSLEAYDTYLRAKSHSHRGLDAADVDAAIATFERAVALDPDFARAHAELASAYATKFFHFDPRPEWEQKAAAHIEKSLSLDPQLPEAYVARGNLEWTLAHGFPHEKAIADFRRALEINPNLADAHRFLGRVYYHLGFFAKSLEEFRHALRVDPKDFWVLYRIGNAYLYDMEPAKAVEQYDRQPETATSAEKGLALSYLGRDREALAITEAALEREPNNEDILAIHAVLLARKGDRSGAERAIARSTEFGKGRGHFHHDEYWFGAAYALLGEKKEATSWLEKAADHGFPCYPYFEKDPYLDALRGEADFQTFLSRMKAQWERRRSTL